MERFASEKVKDEIVRSTEFALQDFVNVKAVNEDRLEVEIKYCEDKLVVLFYLENPLDFLITNQRLLTLEYLDDKDLPDFSDIGVAEAVKWMVSHVKEKMMSMLEFYPSVTPLRDLIKKFEKDKIIDPGSYEISVNSDKVVLIVRLRSEIDFDVHRMNVTDNDEVVKTGSQYYLIKLTFKTDSGHLIIPESKVHFSASLVSAFPEVNKIRLEKMIRKESVRELICSIKEIVNAELSANYDAWKKRKELLLSLHDLFTNNGAFVTVDLIRMLKLQIGFQFTSGKSVLEMELASDFPKSCPKIYLTRQADEEEQHVNEITGFMTSNMKNDDIIDKTLDLMDVLATKLN